jgi:hypothetical protein
VAGSEVLRPFETPPAAAPQDRARPRRTHSIDPTRMQILPGLAPVIPCFIRVEIRRALAITWVRKPPSSGKGRAITPHDAPAACPLPSRSAAVKSSTARCFRKKSAAKNFLPCATVLPIPDRPNGGIKSCDYGNSIVASEYSFQKEFLNTKGGCNPPSRVFLVDTPPATRPARNIQAKEADCLRPMLAARNFLAAVYLAAGLVGHFDCNSLAMRGHLAR